MSQPIRVSAKLGDKEIVIETGKLAKQAGGAVTVTCGETVVLVTSTISPQAKEDVDFLPLTVDYIEKTFAAGKIPGGFFKREGRPTEQATLISRFIDRPIRPLFPEHYHNETQVIATVLSVDQVNDPDVLAIIGASASLIISDAPYTTPIAGCRVGRVDGRWILNASSADMENSDVDLIVCASKDAVVMVEGGAQEASELDMITAITEAHRSMQPIIAIQQELQAKAGKPKIEVPIPEADSKISAKVKSLAGRVREAMQIAVKQDRYQTLSDLKAALVAELFPNPDEIDTKKKLQLDGEYEQLKSRIMRDMILKDERRIDGRGLADIRPISCEVSVLPRTHGSGLFTRGETQALVVATLGSSEDEQRIDSISGESSKRFMLHYNFPPFSVGEVKFLRSPGRREVGHGALAERALVGVLPPHEDFPYTVRIVSEILESNGSSSMASVCGGTLSLMDAGVPIKAPVAGIAMGLIAEEGQFAVLSDILGDEDHLGDMDFKVTGTEHGITALQMDIKIAGVTEQVLKQAMDQARIGRLHILGKMKDAIIMPRAQLSTYAPKIETMMIKVDKIRDVIGTGGKNIRSIIDATGVKIDIEDDGMVKIFSNDQEAIDQAKKMVKGFTAEAEIGQIYEGTVKKIMEFGAFVEILPKTDGLVHISQIASHRVNKVSDELKEGQHVTVKCIGIDERGKIKLSMKELEKDAQD